MHIIYPYRVIIYELNKVRHDYRHIVMVEADQQNIERMPKGGHLS